MGGEQEVKVLWGPDGGNPNRSDKDAVKGEREGVPRGGVEWKSKVKCQTERKQSVEQASGNRGRAGLQQRTQIRRYGPGVMTPALARSSAFLPGEASRLPPAGGSHRGTKTR